MNQAQFDAYRLVAQYAESVGISGEEKEVGEILESAGWEVIPLKLKILATAPK